MKIISNLVIYYMSKIEISLYNHIVTVSYIGRKSTGDPTKPKIEIGKYDQDGYFMNEYSLEFMRNNIYEFDLSDSSLSSTDYRRILQEFFKLMALLHILQECLLTGTAGITRC